MVLLKGLEDVIKKSFVSVFDDINARTEAWWQRSMLETLGRDRFVRYVIDEVCTFSLFAANRSVLIDQAFVDVGVSAEQERVRYKEKAHIETEVRSGGTGVMLDTRYSKAKTIVQALELGNGNCFGLAGLAGSGKTTLFRYIALYAARGNLVRGFNRIPLFLAVRDLEMTSNSIREGAVDLLRRLEIGEPEAVLSSLLRSGRVVLLLDGLDETTMPQQSKIREELRKWRVDYPKCVLCVSARPLTFDIGFPGFTFWETLPFKSSTRIQFIGKWFEPVSKERGQRLIILSKEKPELLSIGSSPLLLSILCALYSHDLDLPRNKDELFDRAVQGLLGQWDVFRDVARGSCLAHFSLRQRLTVVSWLAAALFREGHIVFTSRTILSTGVLEELSAFLRLSLPAPEELLRSLYTDFGLLVERAPGSYSFNHLQIQEYLVARYIVDNRRERDLLNHRTNQHWQEVLRLVTKMSPNPTDLLLGLHTLGYPPSREEIAQLLTVWKGDPACDPKVRKQMMRDLAVILMRLEKVSRRLAAGWTVEKGILMLIPSPEQDTVRARATLENLDLWQLFRSSAPDILEIVSRSQYSFADLGVKSRLTDALEAFPNQKIVAVAIQGRLTRP